jgi:hypothetical protein
MTAVRRMQALEQHAGQILRNMGYEPFLVSNRFQGARYTPFNLTAHKILEDGTNDTIMVKLKISLHPIESLAQAAEFCRDEIWRAKRFFEKVPATVKCSRYEVWIVIPLNKFHVFEIGRDGIREMLLPGEKTGLKEGAA